MTSGRFWEIIESVNWGIISLEDGTGAMDMARQKLMATLTREEAMDVRLNAINLHDELSGCVGERNPTRGGDDSFDDLLFHIIGLGKAEFLACLSDYSRIEKRGNAPYGTAEGYRESFSYCLPYSSDYDIAEKEKSIECPVCGAELELERISDGNTVFSISKDGDTKEIGGKDHGGTTIYCSKDIDHEIPADLIDRVLELDF